MEGDRQNTSGRRDGEEDGGKNEEMKGWEKEEKKGK